MKAHEYARVERLDDPPAGQPVTLTQRRDAIRDAFRGVALGRYDEELIGTLADLFLDEPARGLVSLVERARNAAKLESWGVAAAPAEPAVDPDPTVPIGRAPFPPSLESEAGFGIPKPRHWGTG